MAHAEFKPLPFDHGTTMEALDRARIVNAVEYIAAELGEINERLAKQDDAAQAVELQRVRRQQASLGYALLPGIPQR